jgi:hypothetical protein
MRDPYNAKLIETTTKRLSQHDKAKIQVYLIEEFSLLVLSRQRLGQSLMDVYGTKCQNCNGFGHIHSNDLVLKKLSDDLKIDIYENGESNYNIFANKRFLDFIINDAKNKISEFENNFNCSLRIHLNLSLDEHIPFIIERINNNEDESDDFKGKYRKMNDMITAQNKSNEDILSENLDLFKNDDEEEGEINSINQEYNESRFENFSKTELEKNNKFFNKDNTYIEDFDQINEFQENFKPKNIIEELEDSKKNIKKQTNNKNNHQELQPNFEKKKNNTKTINNNEHFDKVSSLYKIWNDWLSM